MEAVTGDRGTNRTDAGFTALGAAGGGAERSASARAFVGAPTADSDPFTFDTMFRALADHNQPWIGPADFRFLVVPLLGDSGQVVGGLWGRTMYRWLSIQMLFVPAECRGRGLGRCLVTAAEREARARGCIGLTVDTFSFQALPFYERLGFVTYGALPDFPPGYASFCLCKRLVAPDQVRP